MSVSFKNEVKVETKKFHRSVRTCSTVLVGKLSNRNAQNVHIFLVCLAFLVFKELNNTILKKLTV